MPSTPTIVDFCTDPQLLGLSISISQRTLLKAIYGLPLDAEELAVWQHCTGRASYPGHQFSEVTVIAGARAGKDSRIAAPIVVYEAVFGQHERHLARGERGVIPLVAQDARAARVAYGFVKDYVTRSPLLAALIDDEPLASEISLTNRISISIFPCTLKSLRGWSIPCGVLDEVAFFRIEGQADSDVEVQASIRRGMVGFPAPRLVKISTPYLKGGVLFDDFKRGFATDDPDLLVWKASSVLMNPSLHAERLERQRRLDPLRFAREYEAEFAEDLEAFLPATWIESAVVSGRHELPSRTGIRYVAAVDPSGGGTDAFTVAIVHREGDRIVHDVMKGWSRRGGESLDLEGVVREIAAIVKRYGLATVYGDRYASGWVRERFRAEGIRYLEPEMKTLDGEVKYLDKSAAYAEAEPVFAQGRIDLLDHPTLARELKILERRPRAGGRALIDHPTGAHDDYANSLALALALCARTLARPLAHAVLPTGVASIGEPSPHLGQVGHVRGAGPRAGAVGGQAAKLGRYYNR